MKSIGYLFCEGFRSLWKNRTMSFASIAVLISCLLLTGVASLLSINMDNIMKTIEGSNSVSIYMETDLPSITSIEVGEKIRAVKNIATCDYVPKNDGMDRLKEILDDNSSVLDGIDDESFLPDAYTISMKDLSLYNETMEEIIAIDGVKSYTDYSAVAEKLNDLDGLITYASIAIVALLALVSLFIIANTVKVTMFSRRVEISIMKSVGATNGFIRVPFIVEGLLIGIISGAISASILFLGYDKMTEVIYNIVPFISVVDIDDYILYIYGAYAILGAFFGATGGIISIGRYLKREGENAIL